MEEQIFSWHKDFSVLGNKNFTEVFNYFKGKIWSEHAKAKGEKYATECYVHDVYVHDLSVRGKCWRSQKKKEKPHSVSINFRSVSKDLYLEAAYCTCEAGNSESCTHIIGLVIFLKCQQAKILKEDPTLSSTSIQIEWNKPRGPAIKPQKLQEIIFSNPLNKNRKKDPIILKAKYPLSTFVLTNEEALIELKKKNPQSGLYLLNTNNSKDRCNYLGVPVPNNSLLGLHAMAKTREETAFKTDLPINVPLQNSEMTNIFLMESPIEILPTISFEASFLIEKSTRDQSQSEKWVVERKKRFTALQFGFICKKKML